MIWVGPKCNHKGPYQREVRGTMGEKVTVCDAARSQEMLAASKSWKEQGLDCSLGPLEGTSPACTLILTP